MKTRRINLNYISITVTIGVLLYLAVLIIPLMLSFFYSFTNFNVLNATKSFIGIENYIEMVSDKAFRATVLYTLEISLVVTLLANILGLVIAMALNQEGPFCSTLRTIFFIPQVLSSVVVGFIWSGMLNSQRGLINVLLNKIGLIGANGNISWLGDMNLAKLCVIGVCIWQSLGFCTVVYMAALKGVPQELKDAACVDGANRWQVFRNVTFPLISPGVTVNVVMLLIMSFKLFDIIKVLTAGGPAGATETLAFYVTKIAFTVNRVGYGSAMAFSLFVVIASISMGLGAFLRRREVQY